MKMILPVGLLIMLLAIPTSPARSEVFMDYTFPNGVVWKIGGYEVYDVMVRDKAVGVARVDYRQITIADQSAYRVHWIQDWSANGSTYHVDVDTNMLKKDLSVLMATHIQKINNQTWQYKNNCTGTDRTFESYGPGDTVPQEQPMNWTGRYVDAELLPFLYRNIPYADRNFITLTALDVAQQSFYTPIATVTGSEVVETKSAQYDCWVVSVSLSSSSFTAWYSKTDKHYLVKVRYPDRELVLNHHS